MGPGRLVIVELSAADILTITAALITIVAVLVYIAIILTEIMHQLEPGEPVDTPASAQRPAEQPDRPV